MHRVYHFSSGSCGSVRFRLGACLERLVVDRSIFTVSIWSRNYSLLSVNVLTRTYFAFFWCFLLRDLSLTSIANLACRMFSTRISAILKLWLLTQRLACTYILYLEPAWIPLDSVDWWIVVEAPRKTRGTSWSNQAYWWRSRIKLLGSSTDGDRCDRGRSTRTTFKFPHSM